MRDVMECTKNTTATNNKMKFATYLPGIRTFLPESEKEHAAMMPKSMP